MQKSKNIFGFTLVELLVVIAIIGILSSVAVVNLNSARVKAKQAGAEATTRSLLAAAVMCDDGRGKLNNVTDPFNGGNSMCNSTLAYNGKWPAPPIGFYWGNVDDDFISDGRYNYYVIAEDPGLIDIVCDEYGCVQEP